MLPVLANEGLRGLCSGLVLLGLDAALELAAHRRYIQRIAWWLGPKVVSCVRRDVGLHHRWKVDACLYLLLEGVLGSIAIWEDAGANNMHMIQNGIALKVFVAILCLGLSEYVQVSVAMIDQFSLLVFPEISMRPQLSLDASLLFLIRIIYNW